MPDHPRAQTDKRSQKQRQIGAPSTSIPDLRGLRLHARSTGPDREELPSSCQSFRTLADPPHQGRGDACASLSRNLGTLNRWAREAWETSNAGLAASSAMSLIQC